MQTENNDIGNPEDLDMSLDKESTERLQTDANEEYLMGAQMKNKAARRPFLMQLHK